jgi:LPS export ABC transporter permease LptF
MKIISRYIIKEVSYVTLMGFFIFTFFLIMNSLFVMSDLVVKYGVDIFTVVKLLILLLPSTVAVTLPMAFLVGILLTYSRLVQDNEYHGMQACGISVAKVTIPSILLAIVITAGLVLFNNYVLPAANLEYKKVYYEIVKKRSGILIQEHTFIKQFDDYVFYIGEKDNKNELLKNILIFIKDKHNSDEPVKVITSKEGEFISDEKSFRIALKLKNGVLQTGSFTEPERLNSIFFAVNYVDLDIQGAMRKKNIADDLKGSREMTAQELYAEMKKGPQSRHDKNWVILELHKKFSLPFAVIAFAVIGIPLGLLTRKGGKITAISFSLVLIFMYYILLSVGQSYGYSGKWNHFAAAWLPNLAMIAISAVLFIAIFLPFIAVKIKNRRAQQ